MTKDDFLRQLGAPYDDYRELRKMEVSKPPTTLLPQETPSWETLEGEGQLAIDVFETEHQVIVIAAVAGVAPNDLDIHVTGDTITIHGVRHDSSAEHERTYYYRECWFGAFSRTVVLPVQIIGTQADAELKNGLLVIKIPKASKDAHVIVRTEE